MKTPLLIIPMVVSTVAHANLPDEINYEPYKVQYERLSADVDVITSNLEGAEGRLQDAYNREAQITSSIQNIQDENVRLINTIDNLIAERQNLTVQANDLTRIVNDLESQIQRAQGRRDQLENRMRSEQRRLTPYERRVERVTRDLVQANREVDVANREFRSAKERRERVASELQNLENSITRLESTLQQQEQQLSNIENQISQAEGRIGNLQRNVQTAESAKEREVNKLNSLKAEQATLQSELDALIAQHGGGRVARRHPDVRAKAAELGAKRGEVRTQEQAVTNANRTLSQAQTALQNGRNTVANLRRSQQSLPGQIQSTRSSIQSTRQNIRSKRQELSNARDRAEEKKAIADAKRAEARRLAQEKRASEEELARESQDLERIIANLDRVNERVRNIGEDLRRNSDALNGTLARLDRIDRDLPELRRNVADNRRDLNRLDTDLITTQNQIVTLNEDVNQLRSQQTTAVVARDRKYQEYVSRLDYYNEKLSEAQTLGASQTDVALSLGQNDSNQYVANRSDQLGAQIGVSLAQAQASYWSSVRAEIKGYNDGYATGYSSQADQTRGQQEGEAAGRTAAIDYANTTLKPQFFNEIFAAKLESQNLSFTPLASATDIEMETIETQVKELSDILANVSPVSASEIKQSLEINTNLDSQVVTFKSNLEEVVAQKQSTGVARNVYQAPTNIPYTNFDCSNVYKNIAEFKAACEAEFFDVFDSKYKAEYYATFEAQYNNMYETRVEAVREANIEALYNAGYTQAYPVAEASGISDGKAEIYRQAYAQAYDSGYEAQIPAATNAARGEANQEVNSYIANNATLTLKNSSIQATDLMGGSQAKVNLELKNISPKDLSRPVVVRITNSRNTRFAQREFLIQNAPGNRTINFDDIAFQIEPTATSGQPISVSGEVILNGGLYNARRVERFTVNATTAVNPAISSNLNFDSTPQVVTTFRNRTILHTFGINVRPDVESLRDGYTINISALPDSAEYIVLKSTSIRTGALTRGQTKNVSFNYTLWLAGRGKNVRLKLDYVYQGKTIKSEIVTMVPH
ncbi:MAG: hypothetical protein CME65_13325 [Halobacteriovoraceae bacterium]|nr:hypothetical protein [Halobacteriovoraceae bacterium]|tara:strand:- start:15391 stop:18525 length:3135 start_codon:yes stop_codon:yes gene_type:complete